MSIIDNLKGECMSYTDFDFPHTSLYTSDLREVIANVRRLEDIVKTFVNTEQVKFADPIIWNITSQYAKTTVVLDTEGNAYLSKQAVPSGIQLNNEEYWQEIFNFTEYTRTANQNLTVNEERNTTRATHSYAVDDWLIWNDVLYKVTSPIAIDDALTVGTNLMHFTVEDFIKAFITYATNLINQYKDDIDASELAYRQQLAQDIATTTASLQAQLNAAIAGATVDSEVINARVGWDNHTYSTLGNAIREQITFLNVALENNSEILDNELGIKPYLIWHLGAIPTNNPPIDISNIVTTDTWCYTIIPCVEGNKFRIHVANGTSTHRPYAVIDNSGNILAIAGTNAINTTITIPENGAYLICNCKLDSGAKIHIVYKGEDIPSVFYKTKGRLLDNDNPIDLNDITSIGTYLLYVNRSNRYLNSPITAAGELLVFKSYDSFVRQIVLSTAGEIYFRLMTTDGWTEWFNAFTDNQEREFYRSNELLGIFRIIGVVGDSLASGQGRVNDLDHFADFYDYSWPQQIKRWIGSEVYNFTKTGLTTRSWLTDSMGWTLASDGNHKAQCYIIGLGANDTAIVENDPSYLGSTSDVHVDDYTQNPDTYYGNYARIISMLKTIEPRAKFFVLPNDKYGGTPTIREHMNEAVEYMATVFDNVYYVPLEASVIGGSFAEANKIKSHYTPAGYLYFGKYIMEKIAEIIYNNPSEFYFVNLIGTNYDTPVIE